MLYLKESSPYESIATLEEIFKSEGYLFIRSFFPNDLIIEVRNHVIDVLHKENWGKWDGNQFVAIEPVRRINSLLFHECINRLMQDEFLHDFSLYPPLNWFLSALLRESVFSHPRKMIRITYPYHMSPNDRIPAHQDLYYVKGERDTFTAWIPLGEYIPEQGGLEVSPGTHKMGLFPTESNEEGRFGCNAIQEGITDFPWMKAHYKPGDLLLMHSLLLHRSGFNGGKEFRISLDCRFSSVFGSINEEQLLPPYYPHVSNWDVLSKNWRFPKKFSHVPLTLKIHPKEKSLEEVLTTASKFAE